MTSAPAPPASDGTARTQVAVTLAETEQRYRALAEQTPDAILVHLDGEIVFANRAAAVLLGAASLEDLIGLPVMRLVDPAVVVDAECRIATVLAGQAVPALRQRLRRLDGTWVTVDASASPVQLDGRRAIQHVLRDATVDERATAAASLNEQQHRALFERSPAGMVECDQTGTLLRANEAFGRLLGRPADELVGLRMRDLAIAAPGEVRIAERLAAGEPSPTCERVFVHRDGSRVQATLSTAILQRDEEGGYTTVGTVVDMTERNVARTELEQLVRELETARDEAQRRTALLDAVLDTIDVGVVACDAHGGLTLFNRATRDFHGLPEVPGLDPADWAEHYALRSEDGLTPLDPDQVPLFRALVDGQVHDSHMTIATPGGPARVVRCDGRALTGPDGRVTGAVVAMKDVTDLRASEQRFRAAFQNGPTPMARLDPDGIVREGNPAMRRFLSLPTTRLLGRDLADLVHVEDRGALARALTGTGGLPVELRVLRSDGVPVWCELATTAARGAGGVQYVLAQLLDIDARKANELALERASRQDPLTGLGNRGELDAELVRMLHPATGGGACVLFIDLDGFKSTNDTLGHDAGDTVLVETAARLLAVLRPGDSATRIGGDEFVVACELRGPEADHAAASAAMRRRVEHALAAPILYDGRAVRVSASIGLAQGGPGEDAGAVLARADQAMYADKAERRRDSVASPAVEAPPRPTGRRQDDAVHTLLRTAVRDGRLRLEYQPVIDIASGAIVGAEALLRLLDSHGNVIAPDRFIPLAETDGTIAVLGDWALRTALAQAVLWKGQVGAPDFGIGVNVSPLQLHDPALVTSVEHALDTTGIDPAAVVLEITETRLVPDVPQVRSVLQALVGLGVQLAVDDFGAGYASPGYLAAFPFTVLKIDRRYTSRIASEGPAGGLARGVFALGRESGLVTLAEGVETPEQAAGVLATGCGLGQGYLWHRPTAPAAITAALAVQTAPRATALAPAVTPPWPREHRAAPVTDAPRAAR